MEDTIIKMLQSFAHEGYKVPKDDREYCPNGDNCRECDRLMDECNFFFAQGVRMGLKLGIECFGK